MRRWVVGLALLATSVAAAAGDTEDKAEQILRQPLKDIGIVSEKAPALLAAAVESPYTLSGLRNCRDYRRAVNELTEVLGPDIDAKDEKGQPLHGRLAEAGGRSVVNALIPFRGLVREATGAAENDRRLQRALIAGGARRSFLKGYASARGCKL